MRLRQAETVAKYLHLFVSRAWDQIPLRILIPYKAFQFYHCVHLLDQKKEFIFQSFTYQADGSVFQSHTFQSKSDQAGLGQRA